MGFQALIADKIRGEIGDFITGLQRSTTPWGAEGAGSSTDEKSGRKSIRDKMYEAAAESSGQLPSRKKGGPIRKTGGFLLHKGEYVLTKRQAKKFRKRVEGK